MNEYSFIVEFDEISEYQINKLWEYLENKNIKFHVLKDEDLKRENQQLKEELKQKEDIIDKVIKWIENDYYSMNTTDIDTIVVTNNKLLLIRKFLKGDK